MIPVSKILERKGNEVYSVSPDSSAYDAIKVMGEKGAGTVLVLEDGKIVGIVSERDYTRKVVVPKRTTEDLNVSEIMSTNVTTVTSDSSVEECMGLMTDKKIRHLPVVNEGQIAGVVSIGDVVRFLLSEKEMVIKHYEKYIYEGY
ncbi:MAG: CBS domain-containing protein [Spartobacteria bacterium]|nr:CBS domain-containing protein [Spartobacteria bacterium]